MGFGIAVDVSGPRACFTRPEMKAERVSYDVMTPSAARGILEAIYWKPAIAWRIDGIKVLNEIKFDTFRRNEVGDKVDYRRAHAAYKGKDEELYMNATDKRQQRQTLYLRDVRYVITAHFDLTDRAGETDTPEKHYNIAVRRLRKGQCFNQPYFGCREFAVRDFHEANEDTSAVSFYEGTTVDLGYMLYDLDFENDFKPQFFRAVMRDGFIDVAAAREEVIS
jgi:CRISPR-associated protein Cas5d